MTMISSNIMYGHLWDLHLRPYYFCTYSLIHISLLGHGADKLQHLRILQYKSEVYIYSCCADIASRAGKAK